MLTVLSAGTSFLLTEPHLESTMSELLSLSEPVCLSFHPHGGFVYVNADDQKPLYDKS